MLNRFFFTFLFILLSAPVSAQSIDFLPPGKFSVQVQMQNSAFDQVLSKSDSVPLLTELQSQAGLSTTDVTGGSLKQTSVEQQVYLIMGLSTNFNLYAKLSSGTKKRTGNITTATQNGANFAAKYGPQTVSGIGDTELGLAWQLFSGEFYSFRLSLGYNKYAGANQFATGKDLYIGSGSSHIAAKINWNVYFRGSKSILKTVYLSHFSTATDYSSPSGTLRFQNGTKTSMIVNYLRSIENFHWGIALQNTAKKSDIYSGVSQNNKSDLRGVGLKFGYGNMALLEKGPTSLPWLVEMQYFKPIQGQNTSANATTSISGNLYF